MRKKYPQVRQRLMSEPSDEIGVSLITYYELIFGAYKGNQKAATLQGIQLFLAPFRIIGIGEELPTNMATFARIWKAEEFRLALSIR
jgi:predicted nucleic acid-binding protein